MEGTTVRRFALLFTTLMLLSSAADARAADPSPAPALGKDSFLTEVGFITGFGYGTVTEGDYFPVPLIVHLGVDMKRWFPSLQDHRGVLSAFLEPQFNLVFGAEGSTEGGASIGFKYRYPLNDAVSVYGLYSTGFLFVTVDTVDQANGFNFANAVGIGIQFNIMPGAALDLGFRFRHVSNADLRDPNCGIDSY
ncbi:MAG: acyloxyacyl hydrolase, partial [Syntrophaceae bacterium]